MCSTGQNGQEKQGLGMGLKFGGRREEKGGKFPGGKILMRCIRNHTMAYTCTRTYPNHQQGYKVAPVLLT